MEPSPRETIIKKVRRRREPRFRCFHLLILALLIPILFLPSSVPGHSKADFSIAAEPWAPNSYGVEFATDNRPDSDEYGDYELVEGSAPAFQTPLHVPPIDTDISPERFAKLNGAVPLDRALLPNPPRPFIVIETRRASNRRIGSNSTAAAMTTTTTAFAPVPEPSVALTLTAGACGALLRRRRLRSR